MSFDVLPRMREGEYSCRVRTRASCIAWVEGLSARLRGDGISSPVILLDIPSTAEPHSLSLPHKNDDPEKSSEQMWMSFIL